LRNHKGPEAYLRRRKISPDTIERFGLGYAPEGWRHLVEALHPRIPMAELEAAGLVGRSEKDETRPYDRFRHRLMFPIRTAAGRLAGFGGRTLGDDRAKYINTQETEQFRKGYLLYGLDALGANQHSDVDPTTPPVTGAALVYNGTKWVALPVFPTIGYGGVVLSVPTGIPNLGIGFEVLPADAAVVTSPVTVTQDFANDGIRFSQEGVWNINIGFSLTHNESNSGRETTVQLYNATEATGGNGVPMPIARNQPGTYFSGTLMVEVTAADEGDLYQIRVGGGDSITAVTVEGYEFSATHVSQFVG
jgi:hypothetical protein